MTHRTDSPPTEKQKAMLTLILRSDEFLTAPEVADHFGQNVSTVRGAISEFKNKLGILDYDAGGYYRLVPGRELDAWAYYYYGWDAFDVELRQSAADAVLARPEVRSYLESRDLGAAFEEYQQRITEFQ
jgi:hypothetical protein